ncbi:Hypothetical_protein [Hexamita inflata]|uniref:Hypothetical_protein n=1 Tax=Hexamita inflata TaxID=28002 RepID=A0AA86PX51_9EUKA|nr:Hypothetical protein HINF_LOCUS32993 [Hexamita inflata]
MPFYLDRSMHDYSITLIANNDPLFMEKIPRDSPVMQKYRESNKVNNVEEMDEIDINWSDIDPILQKIEKQQMQIFNLKTKIRTEQKISEQIQTKHEYKERVLPLPTFTKNKVIKQNKKQIQKKNDTEILDFKTIRNMAQKKWLAPPILSSMVID